MSLQKDVKELLEAGIISEETAASIQAYYQQRTTSGSHRIIVLFSVLGAILIGSGILLILAHNWDTFTRGFKTMLAFLPLLTGQLLCAWARWKKNDSPAWRESSAAFLFWGIGASIALISQIYHIPGDTGPFLLSWMLLSLPLVYLMQASATSLMYLGGITLYAMHVSDATQNGQDIYFWLLLLGHVPFYARLMKEAPKGLLTLLHHWAYPISILIALGTISHEHAEWMWIAYVSLLGLFALIGLNSRFHSLPWYFNSYSMLSKAGVALLLWILSFTWFWGDLRAMDSIRFWALSSVEWVVAAGITLGVCIWIISLMARSSWRQIPPEAWFTPLFVFIFLIGHFHWAAVPLVNLTALVLGIIYLQKGFKEDHLGIVNFGLLIITILITCRFFDTDLSFILRGLLFVGLGAGFFLTNYYLLKKRKAHETH
jgi:uncharacterized membrane protein